MIFACGSSITGAVDSFFADLALIGILRLSRLVRHYVPVFSATRLLWCYPFTPTCGGLLLVVSLPDCFGRRRELFVFTRSTILRFFLFVYDFMVFFYNLSLDGFLCYSAPENSLRGG